MVEELVRHVADPKTHRAIVLHGPRQVGKTTALLQVRDLLLERRWPHDRVVYFDFSDDRLQGEPSMRLVVEAAVGLAGRTTADDVPFVFLLDEVEYTATDWGRFLKQAVDRGEHRFVVTSSAASFLRGEGRESGLGRWDERLLEPLSFPEYLALLGAVTGLGSEPREVLVGRPRALADYLDRGGFPEHAMGTSPSRIVRERLRRDIADRAILRDLLRTGVDVTGAKKLFAYLMQEPGGIFVAAERARDLRHDPRTVQEWIRLLLDTGLVLQLPKHARRATARMRAHDKIYPCDHGLNHAFSPLADPYEDPEHRGAVFETAVFRHLREIPGVSLSYFRSAGGLEADFVVDALPLGTARVRVVVEVTSRRDPRAAKRQRLLRVAEALNTSHAVLVCGGASANVAGGVSQLPIVELMLEPAAALARSVSEVAQ